jgi:hypothetical protein
MAFGTLRRYVERWQSLVGGMKNKTEEEELIQLIIANICGALDPATYSVECPFGRGRLPARPKAGATAAPAFPSAVGAASPPGRHPTRRSP